MFATSMLSAIRWRPKWEIIHLRRCRIKKLIQLINWVVSNTLQLHHIDYNMKHRLYGDMERKPHGWELLSKLWSRPESTAIYHIQVYMCELNA